MGSVYTGLMQAVGASEKVFEYIDREPANSQHGSLAPSEIQGAIEFKDVCFSYPTRPDIQVLKVNNASLYTVAEVDEKQSTVRCTSHYSKLLL